MNEQSSIQNTIFNQLNLTKQIFLHIYHFPSTQILLKYQDSFRESISKSCFFGHSCLRSKLQQYSIWIVNFNTISRYSSKNCLKNDKDLPSFKCWSGPVK